MKLNSVYGVGSAGQVLSVIKATDEEVEAKSQKYRPIVPSNLDLAVKTGLTTNGLEFTDEEKTNARTLIGAVGDTDYAGNNKVGLISAQYGYALGVTSAGHLHGGVRTLEDYNSSLTDAAFISKGTLNNVLTQYSKTVSLTEADYEALETKDANTLYLIEE